MVDQVLLLLQALFLVLLALFIWWVMRTAGRDLRLPQDTIALGPLQAQAHGRPAAHLGRLVIEHSPSLARGASFEVSTAPLTLGRGADNAIQLPVDEYASARHARIEALRDGLWVVDLGSTNGTYVNGVPVEGRQRLQEGDLVRVGETDLRVER